MMVAHAVWLIHAGLHYGVADLPSKVLFDNLEYVAIAVLASAWLAYTVRFAHHDHPANPWLFSAPALMPIGTVDTPPEARPIVPSLEVPRAGKVHQSLSRSIRQSVPGIHGPGADAG